MKKIIPCLLLPLLWLSACVSPKQLRKENVYFNEGLDSAQLATYLLVEPVIQRGDVLQIQISTRSAATNQLFSQNFAPSASGGGVSGGAPAAAAGGASSPVSSGYLVDITTGDVQLPLLGAIHADGMTKKQLQEEIIRRSRQFVNEDPIVNIRYLNFRVTFLGNVGQPGTVIFDSERVSFLQALGQVGGIEPGGDLKRILLFREQNGKRSMHIIDLTNGDFFNSPNYYLKQNDVVYVSPTERFLVSMDQSSMKQLQYLNIVFGLANVIFILFTLFR